MVRPSRAAPVSGTRAPNRVRERLRSESEGESEERVKKLSQAGLSSDSEVARADALREASEAILGEVGKLIVGHAEVLEQLMVAIFARGHCLMEGVPGLAKTTIVSTLASAMDLSFRRIQFTPDLMPSDITGTDVIQEDAQTRHRELTFLPGPIFAQVVLADEINRTPPKTQAALLEAMQEARVTVGDRTYPLEQPFFVLATQNPLEQEGTYPLPEAQQDRFMFHVKLNYPNRDEEREILERTTTPYVADIGSMIDGPRILDGQDLVRRVPVPDHVMDFVLDLTRRTRPEEPTAPDFVRELVAWGGSPRASQYLILGGKARALIHARHHVTPEDIEALAAPVLRHRIRPSFGAQARGVTSDEIIERLLKETRPR